MVGIRYHVLPGSPSVRELGSPSIHVGGVKGLGLFEVSVLCNRISDAGIIILFADFLKAENAERQPIKVVMAKRPLVARSQSARELFRGMRLYDMTLLLLKALG